jgi:hypothetical protein
VLGFILQNHPHLRALAATILAALATVGARFGLAWKIGSLALSTALNIAAARSFLSTPRSPARCCSRPCSSWRSPSV